MKRSLIPILLVLAMLLCSCGENSPEAVQVTETIAETTMPVPAVETTEATEPTQATEVRQPNYFAENEITLWEFCEPYIDYGETFPEELDIEMCPDIYFLGTYPSSELYRHAIYGYKEDRSILISDQVETELEVFVREYPEDPLPAYASGQQADAVLKQYGDQIFQAYQKQVDPQITVAAWADQFEGYKLIASQVAHVLKSENFSKTAKNKNADQRRIFPENSFVADTESGNVLYPNPYTSGTILRSFTVNCDGQPMECLVAYRRFLQNFDVIRAYAGEGNVYRDARYTFFEQFSILVPEEYDGLLIGYCDMEEPLLEEEAFYERIYGGEDAEDSEEPDDWWEVTMYEYLDGMENYRLHYWGIIPQEETQP